MFTQLAKRENLSKKIASDIEEAIHSRELKVGAKLPSELDLSQQFNVSRATIREALHALDARGIISIHKGKGIFVEGISSQHVSIPMQSYLRFQMGDQTIIDLIETRLLIEPAIAESAALNRTDEDLVLLKLDLDALAKLEGTPEELAMLDMQFHLHISQATHNSLIALIIKPIYDLLPLLKVDVIRSVPGAINSALVWHQEIFEAIQNADPDSAKNKMKEHLLVAKVHAQSLPKKN